MSYPRVNELNVSIDALPMNLCAWSVNRGYSPQRSFLWSTPTSFSSSPSVRRVVVLVIPRISWPTTLLVLDTKEIPETNKRKFQQCLSFDNSQELKLLKLLKNIEVLNTNMVRISVGVRQWEYKSEDEAEREVEDEGAVLLVSVDSSKDGYKSAQKRRSWRSERCDVKNHEGNTLCLSPTYENRIIT